MSIPEFDSPLQEASPVEPKNLSDYLREDGQFLNSYVISGGKGSKIPFQEVIEVIDDEKGFFGDVSLDTKKALLASIVWLGSDKRELCEEMVAKILGNIW